MFNSRRGITPLVATVLLVAFSVGLGALVMSWGEEYIAEKAEFAQGVKEVGGGCNAVEFSLIRVSGIPQVCYNPTTVDVWLDNGPLMDIFNINARVAGSNGISVTEEALDVPLMREDSTKLSVPYSPSQVGNILQVRLAPKIYVDGEIIFCNEAAITVERIPPC